jgi:hypothetical protein
MRFICYNAKRQETEREMKVKMRWPMVSFLIGPFLFGCQYCVTLIVGTGFGEKYFLLKNFQKCVCVEGKFLESDGIHQ